LSEAADYVRDIDRPESNLTSTQVRSNPGRSLLIAAPPGWRSAFCWRRR